MSSGLLFSHPTGNANVRAALTGLFDAGILEEYHTSIAAYPGNIWDRIGKTNVGREFNRRKFDDRLATITTQYPWRELARMVSARLKLRSLTRHETGAFCIDNIYQTQDRTVARYYRNNVSRFGGVYTYEDCALATLTAARQQGAAAVYDLPIGYWRAARRLLEGEFERMPAWASTLSGFKDSKAKLDRKDAELAQATKIVVASSFTAQTLADYPGKLPAPIVVPYGFPAVGIEPERSQRGAVTQANPLRLLFVGGLSQRKGIADLFTAVNKLGPKVSLTVIGNKPAEDCPALNQELARHRWIPSLPHERILEEMRAHDVFVFPSLFEGFGLVITEAMSQGTPVVTTERTAGPDLITHGENGWLVKAGSTEALGQQLEYIVEHPDAVYAAGVQARRTAAARPWTTYGHELAVAIRQPA